MTRYDHFMGRLAAGEAILIDGATGTECDRRGVPLLENAWNGGAAVSHPDIVRQIHRDYLAAGAEIVISNTFGTSLHALTAAGVGADFELYNRQAVQLAVEARVAEGADGALVAGGISYWSWIAEEPELDDLRASIATQAAIMRDAGADLLMLEMMVGIPRMITTLEAALSSGLPVWVGLSCKPSAAGAMCLYDGEPLQDALAALKDRGVPLVSIMHTQVPYVDDCLKVMAAHWDRHSGVYAHTSTEDRDKRWIFQDAISPEGYAAEAKGWLNRGVQIIGGCCGIGTEHISALREIV
ncbi:MAG: homocysteine S-methyltransferase family protein [Pseudomonadota bacterium]